MTHDVAPYEFGSGTHREMTLRQRWEMLMRAKWLVFSIVFASGVLGVTYALLATPIFRAEVLLAPAPKENPDSALFGSLTSLASLAGLGTDRANTIEALAVLRSRDFTRSFIEDYNLLPVLFHDQWDVTAKRWKETDPAKWPDMQKAVKYFDEAIRQVRQDKVTGLVSLSIDWTDPVAAAKWANDLAARLNASMRARAVREAQVNVEYLKNEMSDATIVTLQQSVGRLLEVQMQKLMLARGNVEFAFRILDRAEAPKRRISPMRTLIVLLATMCGTILAVMFVFIRAAWRMSAEPKKAVEQGP